MNLFEKIFNHQIIARLEDSDTFMITLHERAWLKSMLAHPAATDAFTTDTLAKLHAALDQDQVMDITSHVIEKARSMERQVYHPLLRPLRRSIMNKTAIRITYAIKSGRINTNHSGFPYKLEYSMTKREWYLLWYHNKHRVLMNTKLENIHAVTSEAMEPSAAAAILKRIEKGLASRKREAVIELVPVYNAELSRILYAFSCFEKHVAYYAERDTYCITVTLLEDEMEYLLSKLRFLGKRVRVIEGAALQQRMLETSTKALERYGESVSE